MLRRRAFFCFSTGVDPFYMGNKDFRRREPAPDLGLPSSGGTCLLDMEDFVEEPSAVEGDLPVSSPQLPPARLNVTCSTFPCLVKLCQLLHECGSFWLPPPS